MSRRSPGVQIPVPAGLPAALLNAVVVMIGRVANVVDAAIEDAAGPG